MSSRVTNPDNTSQSGVSYPSGSSSSGTTQKNIKISLDDQRTRVSKLGVSGAFNGHAVEIYADGAVWDTSSGAYLFPGRDYNPSDLQRT